MTKEEARKHLADLSNHKANRLYLASFPSTSLAPDEKYIKLLELANEAKKVLGIHRFQRSFEDVKKEFPTMTREYYDEKRRKENIQ